MSISDNYNTGKRKTLEEIIRTPTAELTQEEQQLLIDLPSMSREQLAERFTADEIAWIERSHKMRDALRQMPKENQLRLFNAVADHLDSIAKAFSPFVDELAQKYEMSGRKTKVTEQADILLRCVLAWAGRSASGEQATDEKLRQIVKDAFNEQIGDASGKKRKASNKKINAGKWSTSAHAHAMTYHPETYDGQPHLIPVHRSPKTGKIDRVQPMLLTFNDAALRVKYSQGLSKKQRFGLNILSNVAATRIVNGGGQAEFTAYLLAEDAQGGGRCVRPSLVDNFAELLEIGCHVHGTIYKEVPVKPDGSPDGLKPSDKIGVEYSGIVLPFDRVDKIMKDRIQRTYYPLVEGALPLAYRAGEGKSQILNYLHRWIAIPDASYTDDRLFAVYYLMEHLMQAQKRQLNEIKTVANRARRSRGKAISQAEINRLALLSAYDADKNADLQNMRFDTLFEHLEIDGEKAQMRMKNFLIENVLKYWQNDPTMPLSKFNVKRSGKKVTGIQFFLDLPDKLK